MQKTNQLTSRDARASLGVLRQTVIVAHRLLSSAMRSMSIHSLIYAVFLYGQQPLYTIHSSTIFSSVPCRQTWPNHDNLRQKNKVKLIVLGHMPDCTTELYHTLTTAAITEEKQFEQFNCFSPICYRFRDDLWNPLFTASWIYYFILGVLSC